MDHISKCDYIDNQLGYLYLIVTPQYNELDESLYYIGSRKTNKFIDYSYKVAHQNRLLKILAV